MWTKGQDHLSRRHRAALLLAAGRSERMGYFKPLLPWGDRPLVQFQCAQLREAGSDEVLVVLGHRADELRRLLPSDPWLRWVYNPDYLQGRSSSVRCGARALGPGATSVMIVSVDQPCESRVLERLFREAERTGAAIAVPTYGGRRGHPIVVAGRLVPELLTVSEETQGLRHLVRTHADGVLEVPVDSEVVLWDLNRPEDYRQAHLRMFGRLPADWPP